MNARQGPAARGAGIAYAFVFDSPKPKRSGSAGRSCGLLAPLRAGLRRL